VNLGAGQRGCNSNNKISVAEMICGKNAFVSCSYLEVLSG
jgi:hypothetical protein